MGGTSLPRELEILMAAVRAVRDPDQPGMLTPTQRGLMAIIQDVYPEEYDTYYMKCAWLPEAVLELEQWMKR